MIPKISPLAIVTLALAQTKLNRMARQLPVDAPWSAKRAGAAGCRRCGTRPARLLEAVSQELRADRGAHEPARSRAGELPPARPTSRASPTRPCGRPCSKDRLSSDHTLRTRRRVFFSTYPAADLHDDLKSAYQTLSANLAIAGTSKRDATAAFGNLHEAFVAAHRPKSSLLACEPVFLDSRTCCSGRMSARRRP